LKNTQAQRCFDNIVFVVLHKTGLLVQLFYSSFVTCLFVKNVIYFVSLGVCYNYMQGLGDFCVEPNDALEDTASHYVERGKLVI